MNSKGRITLIELVALLIIGGELLYILNGAFGWMDFHISSGNDGGYYNTCESVAKINSMNGTTCPVNKCSGGDCIHHTVQGYIGYFDSVSNTIVGSKPSGYNSSSSPSINGKKYSGKPGTLVLEVVAKDGDLDIFWTGGKK